MNTILVSNPYPENYWPGYGRYIARDYNEERPAGLENNEIRTGDRPFSYLATIPMSAFSIGDTMDLMTGEITYAPIPGPEPEPEETIEEEVL